VGETALRASELVQQVKERADRLAWAPPVHEPLERSLKRRRLQDHPGLDYAHQHWTLPNSYVEAGHGPKAWVRRVFGRLVFHVIGHYLRDERELFGNLLRLNDDLAKRCDELAEALRNLLEELDGRFAQAATSQEKLATMLDRGAQRPTGDRGP
jgi:hypothetical protein